MLNEAQKVIDNLNSDDDSKTKQDNDGMDQFGNMFGNIFKGMGDGIKSVADGLGDFLKAANPLGSLFNFGLGGIGGIIPIIIIGIVGFIALKFILGIIGHVATSSHKIVMQQMPPPPMPPPPMPPVGTGGFRIETALTRALHTHNVGARSRYM